MKNPIISYPDNIRDQCGIDTVIFTYSNEIASKLKSMLSDNFHIIYHDMNPKSDDELEWMNDALYHAYILILSKCDNIDPFICGYNFGTTVGHHSNLIVSLSADRDLIRAINVVTGNSAKHFDHVDELANYIETEE